MTMENNNNNNNPENSAKGGDHHQNDAVPSDHHSTTHEGSAPEDSAVKERAGEGNGVGETDDAKETDNVNTKEGDHVNKVQEENASKETGESEAPPPEIHYTLESVSEEFDQFLSTLSAHKTNQERRRCGGGGDDDGDVSAENGHTDDDEYLQIPPLVGNFLDLMEEKLAKYDSEESRIKWCQVPEEYSSFLEAVDRVSKLLDLLKSIRSCLDHHGPLINYVGSVQQRAMAFLEEEFRFVLEESAAKETTANVEDNNNQKIKNTNTPEQDQNGSDGTQDKENPDGGSDDSGIDYPGYSEEIMTVLRKIAGQMIGGGFGGECKEVYLVTRRNILMQTLKDQEFEKVSIDEVQKMSWEALEREIPIWSKTFKDCSTVYFPGELKLAGQIFPEDQGKSLFSIITYGLAMQFLSFAEAVAMTKRSTEKLFKLLDIYETLRDQFPAMESLFSEEYCNELRTEMISARGRLGETAILIFSDLEISIKSDSSKTPVPGGAVHPLTRYTMNYLKYSCDQYKDTLEQVFKEHSKIERVDSTSQPRHNKTDVSNTNNKNTDHNDKHANHNDMSAPFSRHLMKIMDLLDANLEAKSKLYKDTSLSSIFMMNNGRYIVQKIKGSPEIHQVMGDTWCRRRSSELRNYHKSYQRETWGKLLGFLNHEGLMHHGKIVKPNLKERFKSFNSTFDEIHKTQSSWVVNDEQLQSELRVSISAVIIPAYRSFMARFSQHLDPGRQTEKYIKFQPEDIENLIDDLFDGNASSSTMSRKRT